MLAAAVLLLGGGYVVVVSQRLEAEARSQVVRTQAVLFALDAAFRAGLNAETGERGYLLTGDEGYLDPFDLGAEAIADALADLEAAIGEEASPFQRERIDSLRRDYALLFQKMTRTIDLARRGQHDRARALVATGEAKRLMDSIRRSTEELEVAENELLAAQLEAAQAFERRSSLALVAMGVAALVLLAFAVRLAFRAVSLEAEASRQAAAVAARDMAELRARELNHRVKNLFSIVLAIVALTGRSATTPKEAVDRARERIIALARAHEASQGGNDGASFALNRLINLVLAPYDDAGGSRISANGPDVELTGTLVTPLGLILHEWATNAAKYGALSQRSGRLSLEWRVVGEGDARTLILDWKESGGPTIAEPPTSTGFGTRMARAASQDQIGGSLEIRWPPEGMEATLTIPLDESRDHREP